MENVAEEEEVNEVSQGRPLRKRSSKPPVITKRRKNDINTQIPNETNIEDVYRQDVTKIVNFQSSSLETIYESPKGKANNLKDFMGVVKLKRQCRFSAFYDPPKIKVKQRKNKARSLKRIGVKTLVTKVTIEQLEKALNEISGDEDEENNSKVSNSSLFTKGWCYQGNVIKPDNSFQAVIDLSSTLADMDMRTWNCEEDTSKKSKDSVPSEQLDLKCDLIEFSNINDSSLFIPLPNTEKTRSTKDRRRSGRILPNAFKEPLKYTVSPKHMSMEVSTSEECSINMPTIVDSMETDSFSLEKEQNYLCDGTMESSKFHHSSVVDVQPTILNGFPESNICSAKEKSTDSAMETLKINLQQVKKATSKKSKNTCRRTSGIRRPLYPSLLNDSENLEKSTECIDFMLASDQKTTTTSNKNKLLCKPDPISPTCLFNSLKIGSPGSIKSSVVKSRRRSARLSVVGLQMGSVWTDCKQNKTDNHSSKEYSEEELNRTKCDSGLQSQDRNCMQINKYDIIGSSLTEDRTNGFANPNTCLFVAPDKFENTIPVPLYTSDSPVVSGMFESRGRIFNGKKYYAKQSNDLLHLSHFEHAKL